VIWVLSDYGLSMPGFADFGFYLIMGIEQVLCLWNY